MAGVPHTAGIPDLLRRVVPAAVLAVSLAMSVPAPAQTYYVGLGGGSVGALDSDLRLDGSPPSAASFEADGAAAAVFGFESHDGWRLEGELSWRRTRLETLDGAAATGAFETWATMVNVFYRVDAGPAAGFYLGGGVGAARVEAAGVVTANGPLDAFDLVPAWQVGAGIEYEILRRTTLAVDYRYLVANRVKFVDDGSGRVETDLRSNSAMIGLRFGF